MAPRAHAQGRTLAQLDLREVAEGTGVNRVQRLKPACDSNVFNLSMHVSFEICGASQPLAYHFCPRSLVEGRLAMGARNLW